MFELISCQLCTFSPQTYHGPVDIFPSLYFLKYNINIYLQLLALLVIFLCAHTKVGLLFDFEIK